MEHFTLNMNFFQLFRHFPSPEHHKKRINELNHRFSLFVINVSFRNFLSIHNKRMENLQHNSHSFLPTQLQVVGGRGRKKFNVFYAQQNITSMLFKSIKRNWENFQRNKLLIFISISFSLIVLSIRQINLKTFYELTFSPYMRFWDTVNFHYCQPKSLNFHTSFNKPINQIKSIS